MNVALTHVHYTTIAHMYTEFVNLFSSSKEKGHTTAKGELLFHQCTPGLSAAVVQLHGNQGA